MIWGNSDRWSPFEFPLYSCNAHAFLSLWFSNYSRRFESMKRRCSPWKNGTDATHASTKRAVSLAKTDEQSSSQKLSQNSELTLPFIQLDWNSSTWPLMVGYIIHRQFPCCSVHKTPQAVGTRKWFRSSEGQVAWSWNDVKSQSQNEGKQDPGPLNVWYISLHLP